MQRHSHLLRQEDETVYPCHTVINNFAVDLPQEFPECRNLMHIIKLGDIRNHCRHFVFRLQFIDSPQKRKICCENQEFRFTWILLQPRPHLPHSYELFYERDIPAADLMADYAPTGPVCIFQVKDFEVFGPCSNRQGIDNNQRFICIRMDSLDQIPLKVIRCIGDTSF